MEMEIPIRYVGSTIKNHLEVFDYQFKKSCTVEGLIRAPNNIIRNSYQVRFL